MEASDPLKDKVYSTLTGVRLPLGGLKKKERIFLRAMLRKYQACLGPADFCLSWRKLFESAKLNQEDHIISWRICRDFEARLSISHGKSEFFNTPNYISEVIIQRIKDEFGSNLKFFRTLSDTDAQLVMIALSSPQKLTVGNLIRVLRALGLEFTIDPRKAVGSKFSPYKAMQMLACLNK